MYYVIGIRKEAIETKDLMLFFSLLCLQQWTVQGSSADTHPSLDISRVKLYNVNGRSSGMLRIRPSVVH
jgi:hypothetical protein